MIRTVSFVIVDGQLIDLDWILPVVAEFSVQGWRTHILVVPPPDAEKHDFLLHLAAQVADEVEIGLDRYEPLPGAATVLRWSRGGGLLGSLARLYASDRHLRFGRNSVLPWRRDRLQANLVRRFARSDMVFVSYRKNDGDGTPSGIVQAALAVAGRPVVAYPSTADFHVALTTLHDADLVLTNTEEQREKIAAITNAPVMTVGVPKFDGPWRQRVLVAYEAFFGHQALPMGRMPVLLVLKNESSPIWSGISWADTTLAAIEQLRGPDRYLILKPHPRQDMNSLRDLLASIPPDDYRIDMAPLSYWSERVEAVVALFSGGALEPLAAGKVPHVYWPITDAYRQHLQSGEAPPVMTSLYLRSVGDSYRTQYSDFAVTISTPQIRLAAVDSRPYLEHFQDMFRPAGSARRIVEVCNSLNTSRSEGAVP
mgnify:CR=1 FL=1